jgi:Rrf2 family iron-sulfur cluster assembly transcriptional regulator
VFSQSVEDALRAILYIAGHAGRPVRVARIATQVRASPTYLAKVLSQLVAAGILESIRGPRGGFRLGASPDAVSLARVAAVFGPDAQPRRCLLGHGVCGKVPGCAAHERWAPVAKSIDGFFADTTVSDLLRSSQPLS